MFIVSWIMRGLIARGLSNRAAGPLAWAIMLAIAAAFVAGGWALTKHRIISRYDAEQRAAVAEKQLQRVGEADAVDKELKQNAAESDAAVKGAIDNAVQNDPQHGSRAAGPVSNAAADELRRQRRAAGNRRQPPAD